MVAAAHRWSGNHYGVLACQKSTVAALTIIQNDTCLEWRVNWQSHFGHGVLSRLIPQLKFLLHKKYDFSSIWIFCNAKKYLHKKRPAHIWPHHILETIINNEYQQWPSLHHLPSQIWDRPLGHSALPPPSLNSLISSCMVEHYLIFFLNKFIYYDVDGTFCLLATIVSLLFSINSESFLQKLYIPSTINTDMTNSKALRYTASRYANIAETRFLIWYQIVLMYMRILHGFYSNCLFPLLY